jgi:NTP pyrophosphatase (non-canonical NTP hydrolase)
MNGEINHISAMQEEVRAWTFYNFQGDSTQDVTLGIAEETGELCRAVLKRWQGIRGTHAEWTEELKKEAADVFIKLCHLAAVEDFDLWDAIWSRWSEVKQRDFIKDPMQRRVKGDWAYEGDG